MHIPLVIGNWKMNPATKAEAITLAKQVKKATIKLVSATSVVVAPPTLYIDAVRAALGSTPIALGAQHVLPGPIGAYTGNISVAQAKECGVSYVIIGHSEQRKRGQADSEIAATALMALKLGLTPVICIGEEARDAQATFYKTVTNQLKAALAGIPTSRYKDVVIAYEPVWAIGTGVVPSPQDVYEMVLFIEKVLADEVSRVVAKKLRVIYGGSVTADSAKALYHEGHVAGFLVGGASLSSENFTGIIKAVQTK